jgi:hypothetical protein
MNQLSLDSLHISLEGLSSASDLEPQDVQFIGCYSFILDKRTDELTIEIPGIPIYLKSPLPRVPFPVIPTQEAQFVDANTSYSPLATMDCLFDSAFACIPDASFELVDFVTDRNSLRKLLKALQLHDEPFTMQLESINGMIVFGRDGKCVQEVPQYTNFGPAFEEALTQPHHTHSFRRIVAYSLLGLRWIVRFEVDAVRRLPGDDEVDSIFSKLSLNLTALSTETSTSFISIELKSKNSRHPPGEKEYEDFWGQMFFSATPLLILGLRNRASEIQSLEEIGIKEVSRRGRITKERKQQTLAKLRKVLTWIQGSLAVGDKKLLSYDPRRHMLTLTNKDSTNMLSDGMKHRLQGNKADGKLKV